MKLKNLIPMLNVGDIKTSLEFYHKVLGFKVVSDEDALDKWRWATIRSGDTELMLSETGSAVPVKQGLDPRKDSHWPVIFYFYPEDVELLYAHVVNAGYHPTPLEETHYGMREFSLQDPDGHLLSFGENAGD